MSLFLAVNLVNAVRKSGDLDDYIGAGQRLLSGAALYENSSVAFGFVGPPAQALLFVPLAPLALAAPVAARVIWYVVNVALLWYAVRTWTRVMLGEPVRVDPGAAFHVSRDAALALAAVAFPLQTQFEHQNLNVVLLALSAYAADAFQRRRPWWAGLALGVMAAVKVYPALVLLWLALRRHWSAAAAAVVAIVALNLAPLVFRSLDAFLGDIAMWQMLAGTGWPIRRANQSVLAMWGRYLLGEGPDGYSFVTIEMTAVMVAATATAVALVAPLFLAAAQRVTERQVDELVYVIAVSVLISPIAWEHYWVAWFPVMLALRAHGRAPDTGWARGAFWVSAVLITVLSALTAGSSGVRVLRAASVMTWGGLVSCGALAILFLRYVSPARDDTEKGVG